jgi:hypothetical protein
MVEQADSTESAIAATAARPTLPADPVKKPLNNAVRRLSLRPKILHPRIIVTPVASAPKVLSSLNVVDFPLPQPADSQLGGK